MAEQEKEIISEEIEEDISEDMTDTPEDAEEKTEEKPETSGAEEESEKEIEESVQEKDQQKPEKKIFKKKEKEDKKKDKAKEKIEELEDRVKRQMAEFDNFRKRSEKEKSAMFETGAKSVIEKILPVVDNFERGLQSIGEEEKGSAFADGMQMIYKQLMTELENLGVTPIEAVGTEFDPELHNAVMQVASEEYESGIVAQELQKGYKYRETVVRHSMVAVVE
ncbi:MAG: nucleotide exchange factor GrpE [Roseburia sp.]|nr:nucleotide exchange factor GrpE [Roseburia sp.]MCM1279738.1 nucleotide exchange factor GrpE [Robinsoniella sp.]